MTEPVFQLVCTYKEDPRVGYIHGDYSLEEAKSKAELLLLKGALGVFVYRLEDGLRGELVWQDTR